MGTGLLLMVAKIVRKKLTSKEQKSTDKTIRLLSKILKDTEEVVDLDIHVYQALMKSYAAARRKKNSPEAARRKIEIALANSFRLQADLALLILMAKETLPSLIRVAKGSIANDLLVARAFLDGAFEGALATAQINLAYIKSAKKRHFSDGLDRLKEKYRGIKIL